MTIDRSAIGPFTDEVWDRDILPALTEYIRIPNVSEAYDAGWAEAGHMDRAVELARAWCETRDVAGLTVEVVRIDAGRRCCGWRSRAFPALTTAVRDDPVLLYGHLERNRRCTAGATGSAPGRRSHGRREALRPGRRRQTATPCSPRSPPSSGASGPAGRTDGAASDRVQRGERQPRPARYVEHLAERIGPQPGGVPRLVLRRLQRL